MPAPHPVIPMQTPAVEATPRQVATESGCANGKIVLNHYQELEPGSWQRVEFDYAETLCGMELVAAGTANARLRVHEPGDYLVTAGLVIRGHSIANGWQATDGVRSLGLSFDRVPMGPDAFTWPYGAGRYNLDNDARQAVGEQYWSTTLKCQAFVPLVPGDELWCDSYQENSLNRYQDFEVIWTWLAAVKKCECGTPFFLGSTS